MITYKDSSKVYLEGKLIGNIKPVTGGYRYVPKGQKTANGGEIFKSVEAVKTTL